VRRVVIETTGLADPAPILHTMMRDPFIALRYRLEGVVTLVDAVHGAGQLRDHGEAVRQAAMSDLILLSKTDVADAATIAPLRAQLAGLNPGAPVTLAAEVPAARLLSLGLFDVDGKTADVRRWLAAEAHTGHHHHSHDVNRHDARIQTFCVTFDQPLQWQGIGACLEMLVATRGESLLRVKGILNLAGQERPVVIHGVQHMFHEPALLAAWPEGDDRHSRIVFITADLDRRTVEDSLRAFAAAA